MGKELIKKEENAVGHVINQGRGLEAAGREDFILPRLALAQANSPQVKPSDAKYVEGLNQGVMFNNVTEEIFGQSIEVIPITLVKNRILFSPEGMQECRSTNSIDGGTLAPLCETCPHSQWGSGKDGQGVACTLFYNFAVMTADTGELMIVSFKSSGVPMAKQWISQMKSKKLKLEDAKALGLDLAAARGNFLTNLDLWTFKYKLKVVEQKAAKGSFYLMKVSPAGVVDKDLFLEAGDRFKQLSVATFTGADEE